MVDFSLIDNAFAFQGGSLAGDASPVAAVPVPEPNALALAIIAATAAAGCGVIGLRRRLEPSPNKSSQSAFSCNLQRAVCIRRAGSRR